jgi:hypothetical protein
MRRVPHLILSLLFLAIVSPASAADRRVPPNTEWIILVGGPSMYQWEKYKAQPHDHWWANFVHAARLRTEEIRAQYGPDQKITWLIYRPGYEDRGVQEKQNLVGFVESVRDKYNLHLVWFGPGVDVLKYINAGQPREQVKIGGFEYFGHSNKACFMFDYSNIIDSACKSWLHEKDLSKIDRRVFAKNAYIKSWGCHTGESMSQKWYTATGTRMIGAIGKTQFMMEELPILSSPYGKWAN